MEAGIHPDDYTVCGDMFDSSNLILLEACRYGGIELLISKWMFIFFGCFVITCPLLLNAGEAKSESESVRVLIEQLGADDADERELAEQTLIKVGAKATPLLNSATAHKDLEVRLRVKRVLNVLNTDVVLEKLKNLKWSAKTFEVDFRLRVSTASGAENIKGHYRGTADIEKYSVRLEMSEGKHFDLRSDSQTLWAQLGATRLKVDLKRIYEIYAAGEGQGEEIDGASIPFEAISYGSELEEMGCDKAIEKIHQGQPVYVLEGSLKGGLEENLFLTQIVIQWAAKLELIRWRMRVLKKDATMQKIELLDKGGVARVEMTLMNLKTNIELKEDMFAFAPDDQEGVIDFTPMISTQMKDALKKAAQKKRLTDVHVKTVQFGEVEIVEVELDDEIVDFESEVPKNLRDQNSDVSDVPGSSDSEVSDVFLGGGRSGDSEAPKEKPVVETEKEKARRKMIEDIEEED